MQKNSGFILLDLVIPNFGSIKMYYGTNSRAFRTLSGISITYLDSFKKYQKCYNFFNFCQICLLSKLVISLLALLKFTKALFSYWKDREILAFINNRECPILHKLIPSYTWWKCDINWNTMQLLLTKIYSRDFQEILGHFTYYILNWKHFWRQKLPKPFTHLVATRPHIFLRF